MLGLCGKIRWLGVALWLRDLVPCWILGTRARRDAAWSLTWGYPKHRRHGECCPWKITDMDDDCRYPPWLFGNPKYSVPQHSNYPTKIEDYPIRIHSPPPFLRGCDEIWYFLNHYILFFEKISNICWNPFYSWQSS